MRRAPAAWCNSIEGCTYIPPIDKNGDGKLDTLPDCQATFYAQLPNSFARSNWMRSMH